MLLDMTKVELTHDNDDKDPWQSLAAATARLLEFTEQSEEDGRADSGSGSADKQSDKSKVDDQRRAIEQRLRELSEWEKRIKYNRLKRVIRR